MRTPDVDHVDLLHVDRPRSISIARRSTCSSLGPYHRCAVDAGTPNLAATVDTASPRFLPARISSLRSDASRIAAVGAPEPAAARWVHAVLTLFLHGSLGAKCLKRFAVRRQYRGDARSPQSSWLARAKGTTLRRKKR